MRVWIEIFYAKVGGMPKTVTLSVRVWIEISSTAAGPTLLRGHPQCEGVD